MRKSDGVRVYHKKKSDGVRVKHEKKNDGVRVDHEKKSDEVRVDREKKRHGEEFTMREGSRMRVHNKKERRGKGSP